MSNAIDDKELDDYLSGDTQFSQRYRAIAADAVPSELDSLVLGNAKANNVVAIGALTDKQVGNARRAKSLGFWMRISVPVALAASFVFAISIMMDSSVQHDSAPFGNIETQSLPEAPTVKRQMPVEQDKLEQPAKATEQPAIDAPARATKQIKKLERIAVSNAKIQRDAADAAAPAEVIAREEAQRVAVAPATLAPAEAPVLIPSNSATERKAKAAPESDSRNVVQRSTGATNLEEIIVTAQTRRNATTGTGPRGSIPSSSFSEREPSDAEIGKEQRESNPAAWLAYIRELRASSKTRAADREWQQFAKAFPDFRVDETDTARPKK